MFQFLRLQWLHIQGKVFTVNIRGTGAIDEPVNSVNKKQEVAQIRYTRFIFPYNEMC